MLKYCLNVENINYLKNNYKFVFEINSVKYKIMFNGSFVTSLKRTYLELVQDTFDESDDSLCKNLKFTLHIALRSAVGKLAK